MIAGGTDGRETHLWRTMGAHLRETDGSGVDFAVWAPGARSVGVMGDFNGWVPAPLGRIGESGIWHAFAPEAQAGARYQYQVIGADGRAVRKADPVGFAMDLRPSGASRVWDLGSYRWSDDEWMAQRRGSELRRRPMTIYEVHIGSWRRGEGGRWLNYREAAPLLVEHCRTYGFSHVEFLPLAEHPFDGSWGYQVTGYYAPTARYGTPDDLRALVDALHQAGIGVILDWVPAHFARDDYGLARFDGTPLYEHADPMRGEHPDWGTLIFDFARPEVRSFLVSNAVFWLEEYHFDALRVDGVASMLYLDYSRAPGAWLPNRLGGRENLEAIDLLRQVNEAVTAEVQGAFTVAEESTAWPGVTRPASEGGLGFTFKWDLGWMHDTLAYFREDPVHRSRHQSKLTFRGVYAGTEQWVLPLSHDEVVHGKGSLLGKMAGDETQRFANLRALLGGMFTQPGKKLLFMGTELASLREWDHDVQLPWEEGSEPMREAFARYLRDLLALYSTTPALWAGDPDPESFRWIDGSDAEAAVLAYLRGDPSGEHVVVVQHLSPVERHGYGLGLPSVGRYVELINSDGVRYGGSAAGNHGGVEPMEQPLHGMAYSARLTLPPLSCLILAPG